MPVYLHIFNLVIDKKSVIEKYSGGVEQFRIDYDIPFSEINQEDDELFSLGQMDVEQFDIDRLVSSGLSFDKERQMSNDFTIIYRYGDIYWEVNWLKNNRVFAWHIDVNSELKLKMDEISNMTLDYIIQQREKGNDLLRTIRLEN